jgi:hypothetical protein
VVPARRNVSVGCGVRSDSFVWSDHVTGCKEELCMLECSPGFLSINRHFTSLSTPTAIAAAVHCAPATSIVTHRNFAVLMYHHSLFQLFKKVD